MLKEVERNESLEPESQSGAVSKSILNGGPRLGPAYTLIQQLHYQDFILSK